MGGNTDLSSPPISREASPTSGAGRDPNVPKRQSSPLLQLPNDIFKCVMDYLDRDAAWAMKRLCVGMANSKTVDELLYRYPLQWVDVKDIKLHDWKYRSSGQARWDCFRKCITDANRMHIQKLALSHWCSIGDFQWIEANLPNLTSLDISAIKDFVWTPEETWTWKELAIAAPKLFERLEELEVANWADYTAHSRIEYSYSYNDYKFKQRFRMSRRRDGGSVARMIFPLCKKLRTLAIRERYSGYHTWNEWEVHQRVCCLVDGITNHCPPSLNKLRAYDYAPYRSLLSTRASTWSNITNIEIDLYSWIDDRRERDFLGPVPFRIAQGSHHREEEDAFDDKTFEECTRDHMQVGAHVVQGAGASFEDLLKSLRRITKRYPNINISPLSKPHNIVLQPFHLIATNQRRLSAQSSSPQTDPISKPEVQEALEWLANKWNFKPVLAWDPMMCDVFPENLAQGRGNLQKGDVLKRIQGMVATLRSLNFPIRISIGDRVHSFSSSGLDGSLYFGDYKTFIGEGEQRREVLLPTQASFGLSGIAHMVDELIIQYPADVPGVHGWLRSSKRPTPAEAALFTREMVGWRRFWERYARQFKNLKKLTANIPAAIYNDWGNCQGLRDLLSDERWQKLEVEEKGFDYGSLGSCVTLAGLCYNFSHTTHRIKFVKCVFFRSDIDVLNIQLKNSGLSANERDEREISREEIAFEGVQPPHRFWPEKPDEKRKATNGEENDEEPNGDIGHRNKRRKID
ncbi:hypothetical protein DM02DRAFT_522857 [Periconia macrospinosa]|uniref:F-box domain-containing protein n=1 Tax=Periconia macrospinosa TaxID=97972 RepID=A0A2V1DZ93_9PLEO|nr:hypothetical protein DM02DRAFT_522857 [Periconia macrospinosa]